MRTQNAFKNIAFSLVAACISFLLMLINRKVFLTYLDVELLGYESLFTNIFAVMSIAEMGVGTVISYQLYRSIAKKDNLETSILISMYKYLYRFIGALIVIIGIIVFFFLEYIITDTTKDWGFVQKIYLIQLFSTALTYFLAYRRVLFVVYQREHFTIKVDTISNVCTQVLKILVLAFFQNYIIYLVVTLISQICTNAYIYYHSKKHFIGIIEQKVKISDFKDRKVFTDVKHFMTHKLSGIVYYNTDNIIISATLGVVTLGIYTNYYIIKKQVFNLTVRMFKPLQASIGNFVYDKNTTLEDGYKLFKSLDLIGFLFASLFASGLVVVFQPFITIWYGQKFVLGYGIVLLIALNAYIETIREMQYYFRSAFGNYEFDKNYAVAGAGVNLALSIVLGKIFGLYGILIGSVVGMLFLWFSVIKFIHTFYFKISIVKFLIRHLSFFLLATLEVFFTYIITRGFSISVIGIIERIIVCILCTTIINLIVFYKTTEFALIRNYFQKIIQNVIKYKNKI